MKKISEADKQMLISKPGLEYDLKFISSLIGDTYDIKTKKVIKSRFDPTDQLTLNPKEFLNKEKIETTVGRLIFNKVVIEPAFGESLGFINEVLGKKGLSALENDLAGKLLENQITNNQMFVYFTKLQWLSSNICHMVSPSLTLGLLTPNPQVIKERDKMLKENKERIENGDIIKGIELEEQLVKKAREILKDDPGMDLYNSGARGSFENNYKNINIIKGLTPDPKTGGCKVIETNYTEGIGKDALYLQANAVIAGSYPKAVGSADAGYLFKQLVATFQTIVLDKPGSDCGSKGLLEIDVTKSNIEKIMYRYVQTGNKLVTITPENKNSFIGKTIKLRSPMYCLGKKLCNKCAGDIFYKLGIENVGLVSAQISSDILNFGMSSFHDSNQSMAEIDVEKLFI